MRKRERFIISAVLLAAGLLATQLLSIDVRPIAIAIFTIATYFLSAWALSTNLNGVEWLTVLPFPSLYALSVALFYFLLPSNNLTRFVIISMFGVGMYALYLTSNIFAVGKSKTIQLLRAAHAVSFLFLLLMTLFFFNFIFSLQLIAFANMLLVFLVTFPLLFCSLWSLNLEVVISKKLIVESLIFSLVIAEAALVVSFIPSGLWAISLFLTSLVYVGFGLLQHSIQGRLFSSTVREYLALGAMVTVSYLLLISWK